MEIRTAAESDNTYIAAANNKILEYHQSFDVFYKPVETDAIAGDQPTKEKIALVASIENQLIGFISGCVFLNPVDRSIPFGYIQAIWVEKSHRNQKVAQALLSKFESILKEKSITRCELTVDVRNHIGTHLWQDSGYELYQERRSKTLT